MNPFPSLRLQLSLSGISSLPSSQSVRAFCVQMIQNQTPRGKPVARGDGASQGKTSGGAASSSLDASQSWFISRAGVGLCLCVGLVYGHSGAQGETAYPPKTASMRDPDRLCHSIILEPRAAAGPGTSELEWAQEVPGEERDEWHCWGPLLWLPYPLTSGLTSLSQPQVPPGRRAGRSFESQHSSVPGQLPELEAPKSQERSGTSEGRSRVSVRALAVPGLGTRLEDDNWVPSAEFHSVGTCAKENKPRTGHGRRGCLTGCKVTLFTQVWDESPHTLLAFLRLSPLYKFVPPRVLTDISREPVAGGKALPTGEL